MKKFYTSFLLILSIHFLQAQQWGDYTLYSTSGSTSSYLIDTNSTNYKVWTHASTDKTCYSSYLAPGGNLYRSISKSGNSFTGGPICGQLQKVDWNGNVVWNYVHSTTNEVTHHDFHVMPNGNVLLIVYERKTASEVSAAGCSSSIEVWSEKVVEVQPTGATSGTVVWEWKLWDHLVQNIDANKSNYKSSIVGNPQLMNINYNIKQDWVHMNGIDYNPMLDQIVVSSHNLNEWWVIDHSTTTTEAAGHTGGNSGKGGDLLYRWGNPAAYGASGTAILNVTHDAHWIPEGTPNAGRLVGFNNRGVSSSQSAVDQIAPPISGYNYTYGTPSTYQDRHACSGYSSNMGNSNQLPNGNMLVCVATQGNIYEINPAGTTIWSKQVTGSVPQAHRYTKCYVANAAPATPVISEATGVLNSTSATTYQWYLNGASISGATNQSYTPTQNGVYVVRITDVNGCVYMYSDGYNYTGTTSVNESDLERYLIVFPNPSTGIINLQMPYMLGNDFTIIVSDALGKALLTENNKSVIDLSAFKNGLYFISITSINSKTINKKVSIVR